MADSTIQHVEAVEYERRHAELEQRITRLEILVSNLVTQKDLADFKATVITMQETVNSFKAAAATLPSKDELKWQKWLLAVAIGLVVYHLFGGNLPLLGMP